jgi:hypothetical protein
MVGPWALDRARWEGRGPLHLGIQQGDEIREGVLVQMIGRIKLLLSHIPWSRIETALQQEKPIKVTIALTNAKGGPVLASVGPSVAKWSP